MVNDPRHTDEPSVQMTRGERSVRGECVVWEVCMLAAACESLQECKITNMWVCTVYASVCVCVWPVCYVLWLWFYTGAVISLQEWKVSCQSLCVWWRLFILTLNTLLSKPCLELKFAVCHVLAVFWATNIALIIIINNLIINNNNKYSISIYLSIIYYWELYYQSVCLRLSVYLSVLFRVYLSIYLKRLSYKENVCQ